MDAQPQVVNLHIAMTEVAEDGLSYVDVQVVNKEVETHLFIKIEEPNVFASAFSMKGDERENIRNVYEEKNE